jgi:hypothetical protein
MNNAEMLVFKADCICTSCDLALAVSFGFKTLMSGWVAYSRQGVAFPLQYDGV